MSYGQGPDCDYAAIINIVDECGRTRLHEAAIVSKTDDIRHLLIGGFDPSLPDMNGAGHRYIMPPCRGTA